MTAAERYADPSAELRVVNDTLALQLAHRSVRRFTDRPVTDDELHAIVAAAQSAPTSSNLQPWSVVAVRDPERKARLAKLAGAQAFIDQAPLFLIWVADLARARRLATRAGTPLDGADYLESTIIGFVDTSLAAQNAVVAAESLGLGTVFVGAIRNHPREVAAELGLPRHAIATFGLAVGTADPTESAGIKPRLPQGVVLHHEQYSDPADADALIEEYDAALEQYNTRHGLTGTWSHRVLGRLAGPASLNGRAKLRDDLAHLGFPSH
ncbi:NADPH-dependent oxidoreductase [Gordonia rubripertincta]|uniref:NADPH-dependent oxidoreductase n=1 Tax=Gordonia rubripertincta TaxID=36822 RepID=UPI000B8D68C8|nr:NADPH-dependent oxidoreductase [Gordonia rubripertincta]ASR01688.1 NADPH-flavin oxidoreductase [Gordonia rubripertincta]